MALAPQRAIVSPRQSKLNKMAVAGTITFIIGFLRGGALMVADTVAGLGQMTVSDICSVLGTASVGSVSVGQMVGTVSGQTNCSGIGAADFGSGT